MSTRKNRIAFIYLDEIHHIYHFISVAVELSKTEDVHILTHPKCPEILFESIKRLGGEKIKVELLETHWFRKFTDSLKNRQLPRKGFWIKKYKDYILNNFDAVVFTDFFHHYLLRSRKGNHPKLIKFGHGTPGRAYSFNKDLLDFDFQLMVGEFQQKQYQEMGLLKSSAVTGYPKIDAVENIPCVDFFRNGKPTVVYNPHFDPDLTSWDSEGIKVLEFFEKQDKYNLIFAPHLHLFQNLKGGRKADEIPERFYKSDNILIDLGSQKSVDMSYIKYADIYLGDVSSQVYEFIITPRPCIFLNPNNIDYKDDFAFRFWKLGEVISTTGELKKALERAESNFSNYEKVQDKILRENYHFEEGSTASERSAKAIISFLN